MPIDYPSRFRPDGRDVRRRPRRWGPPLVVGALVALAIAAAIWLWWTRAWAPRPPLAVPPAPTVVVPPVPVEPAIRFPLQEPLPPVDIETALTDLLGRRAVLDFFQLTDFPRRFVATVDSLGREHSPPAMWPVSPTAGRFAADRPQPETAVIASTNAARYVPFVTLAESLDAARAVEIYRSLYPQLQAAYQELGFGNRYLNDRVVEVIDLLLATPEPKGPVEVRLFEIKGPIPDPRPWVRWEFVDPQLQSLAAGQKILVRMGPQNRQRVKQALRRIRAEIVAGTQPAR